MPYDFLKGMPQAKVGLPGLPGQQPAEGDSLFPAMPSVLPVDNPTTPALATNPNVAPAAPGAAPLTFDQWKADPNNWAKIPARPFTPQTTGQKIGMALSTIADSIGSSLNHTQATVGPEWIQQNAAAREYDRTLPVVQEQANQAKYTHDLQNQAAVGQIQHTNLENQLYLPMTQLGMQAKGAEIRKNNAEADKAESSANLEKYKEVNGQLYDLSGPVPKAVDGVGVQVPLDPNLAKLANMQPGQSVPLKTAMELKQLQDAGVKTVQANGRSLLVDSQGHTIKDLGAATPMVTMQMQQGGLTNPDDPHTQTLVDLVGQGKLKVSDALPGRVPAAARAAFLSQVAAKYPNWTGGDFSVEQGVRKDFTSGADSNTLAAFNTAIKHMATFREKAAALDNGDVQGLNALSQAFGTQFGSDKATNFNLAKQAFSGEVGKALAGANVGEGDRHQLEQNISTASTPAQLAGLAKTAQELLEGKRKVLQDKFNAGMQGQPNFGEAPQSAPTAEPTAVGPGGHTIVFRNGAWVDKQTGKAVQ